MANRKAVEKRKAIYDFIVKSTQKHGYPPSVREIGEAVGLRSPSTVHAHLNTLKEEGLIQRDDRKTRALSTSAPAGGVPIVGKVTAGAPILAFEDDYGRLPYRTECPETDFALKVRGDSMTGAGILDGDFIIVRQQGTASHGDIVVALLEDEATVKRLFRKNGVVLLMPENENYEPIDGSDCRILGRVIAVVREL